MNTQSRVLVDGTEISFDAYNIGGNNYFKLRDLAFVLNQTDRQFEVIWDAGRNAILMTLGNPYTAVGGELGAGASGGGQTAALSTAAVYLDGTKVTLTAYTINGNNYFKLRDLGRALDFGVEWNGTMNTVEILSGFRYVEKLELTELDLGAVTYSIPNNWRVGLTNSDGNRDALVIVDDLFISFNTSDYPLRISLSEVKEEAVQGYAEHLKSGIVQASTTDILSLNGKRFVCMTYLNDEDGTVFLSMTTILDGYVCTLTGFRQGMSLSRTDAELLASVAATLGKREE